MRMDYGVGREDASQVSGDMLQLHNPMKGILMYCD